jgi:hypothetical protein
MKGKAIRFLTAVMTVGFFVALLHVSAAYGAVTLEVLNPRGEIVPQPILAPVPRLAALAGKRVGIYWNSKAGGDHFWDVVEAELKVKAPTTKIVRYNGPFDPGDARAAAMAREVDAFLYGVGD